MRKLIVIVVMVAAVTALMVAAAGTAYAGNACPDKSKNPSGTPPNCGHAPPAPVEPPAGNCEHADVVLLEDSKIVCLFLGENAQFATKEADCPDALVAVPVSPVVGACVFLPPAS